MRRGDGGSVARLRVHFHLFRNDGDSLFSLLPDVCRNHFQLCTFAF